MLFFCNEKLQRNIILSYLVMTCRVFEFYFLDFVINLSHEDKVPVLTHVQGRKNQSYSTTKRPINITAHVTMKNPHYALEALRYFT